MSADTMRHAILLFNDKSHGAGATAREIADAEAHLGTEMPESFRVFLAEHGWARFAHQELYGLGADVPPYLDLVRNTIAERSTMSPPVPHALIPIMNDGAGNHYCLDTRQLRNGECPVVFWDHELSVDQTTEIVSPSFGQWLTVLLSRLS